MKRLEFLDKLNIITGEKKLNNEDPNLDIDLIFKVDDKEVKIKQFCLTSYDERVIEFETIKGK